MLAGHLFAHLTRKHKNILTIRNTRYTLCFFDDASYFHRCLYILYPNVHIALPRRPMLTIGILIGFKFCLMEVTCKVSFHLGIPISAHASVILAVLPPVIDSSSSPASDDVPSGTILNRTVVTFFFLPKLIVNIMCQRGEPKILDGITGRLVSHSVAGFKQSRRQELCRLPQSLQSRGGDHAGDCQLAISKCSMICDCPILARFL